MGHLRITLPLPLAGEGRARGASACAAREGGHDYIPFTFVLSKKRFLFKKIFRDGGRWELIGIILPMVKY